MIAYIFDNQVGTKSSRKELIFGRHSFSSKNLHHNPMLTKLACYKSSILKLLHSMKPGNCLTHDILGNLDHYFIPSPSTAASGISTSLKRTSCFLLSLGALRHYHHHGTLPLKPSQIMLYKTQLRHCIKHVYHHRISYMVGLGVTAVIFSFVETVPYSKRRHFIIIPASKDKRFGDYISKKKEITLPLDDPQSVRVRSISNKILQALQSDLKIKQMNNLEFGSMNINGKFDEKEVKLPWWRRTKFTTRHLEGLNWEVVVAHGYSENAYSLAGGRIVVYTDLLRSLKSDAEIAAIIAHEVGHVVARHCAETFTHLLFFLIGLGIILLGLGASSFFILPEAMKNLAEIILSPGSRRNEKEADYIGLLLMASAGYDPRVAPKMYEMISATEPSQSKYSASLAKHPSSKKRFEALSKPKVMEEAMARYSKATKRQLGIN